MPKKITEENRRRLAEWETEHEVNEEVKRVLDEAHAAMSANVLAPALLTMPYATRMAVGLQALGVIELRKITAALKNEPKHFTVGVSRIGDGSTIRRAASAK